MTLEYPENWTGRVLNWISSRLFRLSRKDAKPYPPHGIIQTARGREYEYRMVERDLRKPSSCMNEEDLER
jgi:hypothetical protein